MKIKTILSNKYFLLGLILAYTFCIYYSSLNYDFDNCDDMDYVVNNNLIRDISFSNFRNLFSPSNGFYSTYIYIPLTMITFGIEFYFFGLSAHVNHMTNIIFHLMNIILVFILIMKLSKNTKISLLVALLFGIHPMHIESVLSISERKDVLYSFFYLSSLIIYVNFIKCGRNYKYYIIALILFLLSLLSKPTAITLPIILILIDFYELRITNIKTFKFSIFLEKIPFIGLSLIFLIIGSRPLVNIDSPYNFFDNIILTIYAQSIYMFKLFIPLNLSIIYPYPHKTGNLLPIHCYLYSLALILIIGFLIMKSKGLRKDIVFGLLFYFAAISLVYQILPFHYSFYYYSFINERYTYIPYLGLFYIIIRHYDLLINGIYRHGIILIIISVIYLLVLSFITIKRIHTFKDSITEWTDVIKKYPNLSIAYYHRGMAERVNLDYTNAISDFSKAINYKNFFPANMYLVRSSTKAEIKIKRSNRRC